MNCKIVYLESSYPINTRSQRIIDSLVDNNIHVCSWDRSSEHIDINCDNYSVYKTPNVGYGNKFLKLASVFKYANFYLNVIKKKKPEVVICSHWDMLLIATLLKGSEKIVYDNVDIPEFKIGFIERLIVLLERAALKRVEVSLLASRFYLPLYSGFKCIVLENLPVSVKKENVQRSIPNKGIKIGFVGSVRHYELLVNLINVTKSDVNLQLHIYGGGIAKDKLESYCEENRICNVFFHGKFKYDEISFIYDEIDILWAAYPYKSRNVKYAISNKFYESIFYSIPCLFSENTKLGDYVTENKLGVALDPYSIDSINHAIIKIINDYSAIHENLTLVKSEEDISWSKNERALKDLMMGITEND